MKDFEKLGRFILAKNTTWRSGRRTENLVLYDSRDLCTHAVVVGMTGSGKTGLCVGCWKRPGWTNPGNRHRPKGRHFQPAVDISRI